MTRLLSQQMLLKTIREQRTLYLLPSNPSTLIILIFLEVHRCPSDPVAIINIPAFQSSNASLGRLKFRRPDSTCFLFPYYLIFISNRHEHFFQSDPKYKNQLDTHFKGSKGVIWKQMLVHSTC